MDCILDSLYIGNIEDAQAPPPTISAVLWSAVDLKLPQPQDRLLGRIPLREYTEADPMDIESALAWLERYLPHHQILVACRAGMGRSVSIVIAYLCCIKDLPYEEAVTFVRERRHGATPLPRLEQTIEKVKKIRQTQR